MTINEAMKKYRLPNPSTPEDLETAGLKVLEFGDKVLAVVYYYNGYHNAPYLGVVYEHLDGDLSCEGAVGLYAISKTFFVDDGHAIQWAIEEASK